MKRRAVAKKEGGGCAGKLQGQKDVIKFIKSLIGIILIPACIGATFSFYRLFVVRGNLIEHQFWFVVGFISYVIIYSILQNPIKTYVYGHEFSHAIWTWLFKGKVKNFSASAEGGSVTVSKSNFLISLAPYFFPFYTFLAVVIYLTAISFWKLNQTHYNMFLFTLGFTWAFHFVLTIYVMLKDQDDIKENGAIFSIFFIYIANVIILGLLFVYLSKQVTLEGFVMDMTKQIKGQYEYILTLGKKSS